MAKKHVRIKNRLPQFAAEVERKAARAVTRMVITIKAHTVPMIPVHTSDLANSSYNHVWKTGYTVKGAIGFTADYAAALHALDVKRHAGKPRPKGRGVYWGPAGETQFLTKGAEESRPILRSIVRDEMKP